MSLIAISANAAFGKAGIVLALAAASGGAIVTVVGLRAGDRRLLRQGPIYAGLCLAGAAIAALMMQRALITRDFSLAYIQQVGSATTPRLYNVAAMWSALEGSILLWLLILGGFTAAVGWKFRKRTADPLVAWALVVMFVVMAFFALVSFGPADPFGAGVSGPELRTGTEPAAAEPRPRAVPPADPVPRLRRDDGPVRLRHRRPDHWTGR